MARLRDDDEACARDALHDLPGEARRQDEVELADGHERRARRSVRADPRCRGGGVPRPSGRTRRPTADAGSPRRGRATSSMIPSFQIRGAKHHRFTATRKSRIDVRLLRRPHPAPEDLVQEAVAATPGAVQDEAPDASGTGEGELLRDRAAHRRADDVRPLEAEVSMSANVSAAKSAIAELARPASPSARRRGCRRS